MKLYEDINILKEKYELYGNEILNKIEANGMKAGADIKLKVQHGLSMSDSVGNSTLNSGFFNESYVDSGKLDGLLHDIGRFEQYLLSGTLNDFESSKITGYKDHGQYGKYILSRNNGEMLKDYLKNERRYDEIIKEVVGEHTNIVNPNYQIQITELTNVFQNYSLEEILNSNNNDIKNKLVALKLLILREEDSLEIIQKVRDGLWKPALGAENKYFVKDEIWNKFINFETLNMAALKEANLWTCNAGFLLRYSLLLNNINIVGSLKSILEDKTIDKVYEMQMKNVTTDDNEYVTDINLIDPRLTEAYNYVNEAVRTLIEFSDNGIITPKSRNEAKEYMVKKYTR